jgi:transposase InsO family protein
VERMCRLAGVSRAGFYRGWDARAPEEAELAMRAAVHKVALAHRRRYGYRRILKDLRNSGIVIGKHRLQRILREDNLLAIRHRKFILTTESQHECHVYLNLAARMTLTGINQLWVADITYIRLRREFVYLAVVIDRFSRRVIGWALDQTLASRLVMEALQKAIDTRQPPTGLVHHSDRGVQYACADYIQLLSAHGIIPSMSRPANPYDNAACESFMKTLKQEEIYCNEYCDFAGLSAHLEEFLEHYYNRLRLHSALSYRTPEEFENSCATPADGQIQNAATVAFFTPPASKDPAA